MSLPLRWLRVALRKVPLDGHPLARRELRELRPDLVQRAAGRGGLTTFPSFPVDVSQLVMVFELCAARGDDGASWLGAFAVRAPEGRAIGEAVPEAVFEIERAFDGVAGEVVR